MRKVLNLPFYRQSCVDKSGDQKKKPVDQTPVSKQYMARNGFFHTDLHMLRMASDKGDRSLFEAFAQRLSGLSPGPDSRGKTLQQLFDEWKPLYIQTPCEEAAWLEYLHSCEPALYDRLYGEEDKRYEEMLKGEASPFGEGEASPSGEGSKSE